VGEVIVGIDIGSSKVCTLVGRINSENQLDIIGKGIAPCDGVKKGVIVDIERTSASIAASVEQAQASADAKICSAYVNLSGMHVDIFRNRASLSIAEGGRKITSEDVEKLLRCAEEVELQDGTDIIEVIPIQYILNGYDEIRDPVGLVGTILEVEADIVTAKVAAVKNILKSLNNAGLKADGIVLEAFALAELLPSSEDRKNGVVLVDVGGGITNITAIKGDRLLLFDSIPVGGDHITSDISIGLNTTLDEAEKIKREYELALTSLIDNDQNLFVKDVKDKVKKSVKVSQVVEIIEARVYEIFALCRELLDKRGLLQDIEACVILTGSGISHLDGNKDIAGEIFGIPVRVASINTTFDASSLSLRPEFTTVAGIVKYVSESAKSGEGENIGSEIIPYNTKKGEADEDTFFSRISKILRNLF
jgi:cell division protein FtsA